MKSEMIQTEPLRDPNRKMKALVYHGKIDVRLIEKPVPLISNPLDIIVKVTATTVCGSDLHLYNGEIPKNFLKGYILGHEAVGIVDEVGSEIKKFSKGDRVVISAVIACGQCEYCKREEYSCCDVTNKCEAQKILYGHNTGAIFGYSDLVGGYDGCQAEYVRVPYGDVNCFEIPDGIDDKKALMIADIACTGFHGNQLVDVKEGDNVVVFGCGPVGMMTCMWAKYRKAKRVIGIDVDDYRLKFVKMKFDVDTINSKERDVIEAVKVFMPGGPDKVIDCVGFRFPENFIHKFERALSLETDSPNILNTMIHMVRKNGKIGLIGDYFGYTNQFHIGALMEKHLTMSGGQLWPHKYQKYIFDLIKSGEIDPSVIITHSFPFSKIEEVYKMFDKHEDGMLKALLIPDSLSSAH